MDNLLDQDFVSQAVRVNALAIEQEYMRVAADYAYVVPFYARAKGDVPMAKANRDATKALMGAEIRANWEALQGKPPTEARIAQEIAADPAVLAAHRQHALAIQREAYLKGILEAISKKENMLISLGATQRQERQASGLAP